MARFIFEFEAVLKQRKAEEREKQLALGTVERERIAIEDQLREMQGEIELERRELSGALSGGVDVRAVRQQAGAAMGRVKAAQHLVLKLAGVHKRLDSARMELLLATTKRKAVETLREKKLEAWNQEMSRKEAAAIDEITIMRAGRRSETGALGTLGEPALVGEEAA